MRAAYYTRTGAARDVLEVGDVEEPRLGPGQVKVKVAYSGVNPGETKSRGDAFGYGMGGASRVIAGKDGAGIVVSVADNVDQARLGERVWIWGANTQLSGTAAEYVIVDALRALPLPDSVSFEQGAAAGIPGMTAHQAVCDGRPNSDRVVLVFGAAGAVGLTAVQLAVADGAKVIGVVRRSDDHEYLLGELGDQISIIDTETIEDLSTAIRELAPSGVDHVIDVDFASNIAVASDVLAGHGVISAYSTSQPSPQIPFWPLVFSSATIRFIQGVDDIDPHIGLERATEITRAMATGNLRFPIAEILPLRDIALAHEQVERPSKRGKVLLQVADDKHFLPQLDL